MNAAPRHPGDYQLDTEEVVAFIATELGKGLPDNVEYATAQYHAINTIIRNFYITVYKITFP